MTSAFDTCRTVMLQEGLSASVIATFEAHYEKVRTGERGILAEQDLTPASEQEVAPWHATDGFTNQGLAALPATVVIKLNGGLGTSMGLTGPKSALVVRDNLTFFDITARQVCELNARFGARVPFITMDSFSTQTDTEAMRRRHPALPDHVPNAFLQNKYPKLLADTLEPASWPANPAQAWNPPGHGDFYAALVGSGLLASLRTAGIRYAFVSNIDNLGATLSPEVLGWFASQGAPFLMEVSRRTPMDRKGGHLAVRRSDGRLVLRERAQTAPEDLELFESIDRHRFFNTNSIWLDLEALDTLLRSNGGVLPLDLILNRKRLVPKDDATPEVLQLETAIGAAIAHFEGARALCVPRSRFLPVKNCDDLLVVMSDRYGLNEAFELVQAPGCTPELTVHLAEAYFGTLDRLQARLDGVPSLKACTALRVEGDIRLDRRMRFQGDVVL